MESTHRAKKTNALTLGKVVLVSCFAFLVAVGANESDAANEPTLEETLDFLRSYVPAHSEWDWLSALPYAYPIEVEKDRRICDDPERQEIECTTRIEIGEDWRKCVPPRSSSTGRKRKCLTEIWFYLHEMVTEVRVADVGYSGSAVTLTCASGRCIIQRERFGEQRAVKAIYGEIQNHNLSG